MTKIALTQEFATGKFCKIREVKMQDAKFILKLRCDDKKGEIFA